MDLNAVMAIRNQVMDMEILLHMGTIMVIKAIIMVFKDQHK
jgi:hypothetical protein